MTRKLPIWPAAYAVWHHLYQEAGYAIKIVAPWVALALALPLSVSAALGGNTILLTAVLYVFPIGWLAIAVLWHRRYLCRGALARTPVQLLFVSFAYGLQLFGVVLIIALAFGPLLYLSLLTSAAFFAATDWDLNNGSFIGIAAVILALAIMTIFYRIGLALPARTLGDDQFGKLKSWLNTQDHGFRLSHVWALVALPPIVLAILCFTLPGSGNSVLAGTIPLIRLVSAACFISISLLNTISVMSIAYAFLVENEDNLVPFAPAMNSAATQN